MSFGFDDVLSLGKIGLGLLGSFNSRNESNRQASIYDEQAALNRQIGAFNAEIAERSGTESVRAIAKKTKQLVGEQMVSFSNRGITMEGSPMFIVGDTLTMGSQQAQEAYFNAEVNKVNALYRSYGATKTAEAYAESARGAAKVKSLNIFNQFLDGAKLINSGFSDGKDSSGGIFDSLTKAIK